MGNRTELTTARLADGTSIYIEAKLLGGEEAVSSRIPSFEGITKAIEEISNNVMETLRKVQPHKASVEFGIEIVLESGQLTALLVKGSSTANLKIILEWGE